MVETKTFSSRIKYFIKKIIIAIHWRVVNYTHKILIKIKNTKFFIRLKFYIIKPIYKFISINFFMLIYPLNYILSILYRNAKYDNSVLHISYMVHIPYYMTRILRKHGVKADYLAVGGRSPWWDKYDYHFFPTGPWQEFYFFWKVVAKYEVIHSHFGIILSQTGWELPILKRMGRKIILHYRGCEARNPEVNKMLHPDINVCQECDYDGWPCKEGKERVKRIKKYADISLVTTPDLKDFVPDAIHFPFFCPDIDYKKYAYQGTSNGEFKIVHVTNHPGIEGTQNIKMAINNLKAKDYKINFVFLRGVTPEKVLEEYKDADLSIGKMKMGYYANAQIESMFLGVPAVTYLRKEFMTPELQASGFILTHINNLEKTLEYYITHPEDLLKKRNKAREAILRLHSNEELAKRLIDLYGLKNQVPYENKKITKVKRPLRVLHIGNLANNAYYNAKFLRRAGIEADVLCYDNYWVMSSPEWEEVDCEEIPKNQEFPDWGKVDLKGYERPRWFVQGPFELCVKYLIAKQKGQTLKANRLWELLVATRRSMCSRPYSQLINTKRSLKKIIPALGNFQKKWEKISIRTEIDPVFHKTYLEKCRNLIEEFNKRFPERQDKLIMDDLISYEPRIKLLKELFNYYDIVQGYAIDSLYPMLADFRPYLAFEHGTLRDSPEVNWDYKGPSSNSSLGRLVALSYALSDHVFITNADCLLSAKRLGISSFESMPHPFDEKDFYSNNGDIDMLRSRLGKDFIFFCPIRHDWPEKGVYKYIYALPKLREIFKDRFKVYFTPWGQEIEKSKKLISDLKCNDIVEWVGPFNKVWLSRWLVATDVIFDQVAYSSFSGLTPRALASGTPVISSYEPSTTEWMFSESAPVLSAKSVEDIIQQTVLAVTPGFKDTYRIKAREWIERHHSAEKILEKLLNNYRALIGDKICF